MIVFLITDDDYLRMENAKTFGIFGLILVAGSILVAVSFSSVFGGCLPFKFF